MYIESETDKEIDDNCARFLLPSEPNNQNLGQETTSGHEFIDHYPNIAHLRIICEYFREKDSNRFRFTFIYKWKNLACEFSDADSTHVAESWTFDLQI